VKYNPKLDAIRAFAVSAVLVDHYIAHPNVVHVLQWGSLGVQCFFVLSGYLITGILLEAKAKAHPGKRILRAFYMRRFLRIFPPYYAMLAALLLAGIALSTDAIVAAFFYVFNILEALRPDGGYNYLGHIWSLCIEEQFYLLWPIVVLSLQPKRLLQVSAALVVFSVASRGGLLAAGWDYNSVRNLPTSQLDALIGGAILAQISRAEFPRLRAMRDRWHGWIALAALLVFAWSNLAPIFPHQLATLGNWATAIAFMTLICRAENQTRNGVFDWLLTRQPFIFLGKISYGVYLYHFMTLLIVYKIVSLTGTQEWMGSQWLFVPLWTATTISFATLSYFAFERPLLKLKRHFTY